MQSQLERILSSNVNSEVISSIQQNDEEINKLEQILSQKNSEVFNLHQKINSQLLTTVQENRKLKNINEVYRRALLSMKNQFYTLSKYVKMQSFDCLQFIMKEFDELGMKLNQKGKPSEKKELNSIEIQTQNIVRENFTQTKPKLHISSEAQTQKQYHQVSDSKVVLLRLENLQNTVLTLKEEKWRLQKELTKFQSVFNNQQQYNSVNSDKSISDSQIKTIILMEIQNQFMNLKQEKYCGEIINKQKHGQGSCEYSNNFKYQGMFLNGKRQGLGIMKYEQKIIYRGYWKNDCFHGKGVLFYLKDESVQKLSGNFQNGRIEGYGTLQYLNGQRIRAQWLHEQILGNAVIQDENGIYYGCALPQSRISTESNYMVSV